MKFKIYLKDPDGVYEGVQEAVYNDVASIPNLDDEEQEALQELRMEKAKSAIEKWIECMECLTIEIDTDAGTATVLERK